MGHFVGHYVGGGDGSGDGGDVAVLEVDRLVQSSTEGGGVANQDVLARDLASLNLRDPSFGHAHPVGDHGLGEA